MKLRGIQDEYSIGLDMGTGSTGWAAVDHEGNLLYFKGKPTWGSRLYPSAETAAAARIPRGQRRRYVRRRWRLDLLQDIFEDEICSIDPDFFIRLRQSRLLKEDRDTVHQNYQWPLFNDDDFTERDYYSKFPTIYHLRKWLMETDEKADIRLVYLAIHNIVKCRGNFLRQGEKITATDAKPKQAIADFKRALKDWCAERAWSDFVLEDERAVLVILADDQQSPSDKKKAIAPLLGIDSGPDGDKAADKKCAETLAAAMVGLTAEFKNVFGDISAEKTNIRLSDDEKVEALHEACPDDGVELFDRLCAVYSAYVLQGLLAYAPGETISSNMVKKYEQYGEDLRALKELVREYAPKSYDSFFRGAFYEGTNIYDASKAQGYTKYNLGQSKLSYDAFRKEIEKLLGKTDAQYDARYQAMMAAFAEERFLRRLKTSDNGSIYYQLHLEELQAIIEDQGRFHPFLLEHREKLESLVTFRIPYYVGPLTTKNAAKNQHGNRFAWSVRKEGMEDATITPWNWEEVIDRDKSAENFIRRMTGECTYLKGEDVLPRCSLLYEEFCVLNELNGAQWTEDGEEGWHRFDAADREGIIRDLFMRYRTVSYKRVKEWMEREGGHVNVHVKSGQGETGFESKLGSYIFFCKDVFHSGHLDGIDYSMLEEIILWSTLFEDRDIFEARVRNKYGDRFDDAQIRAIKNKRFAGWGRLSREFLTGLKVQTDDYEKKSIMDVLREGNPNAGQRSRTMVLMEVLRDDELRFQDKVDEWNTAFFENGGSSLEVNDLPGSPAIRRSLNQAIRIVDEIARIAGSAPTNIFIEVTRDEDAKAKGKRTKRWDEALDVALRAFKNEDPELWQRFCKKKKCSDMDERLRLYFMQRGKCLYSGRSIDIDQLHNSGLYEVDHIIPRAYIKDDSLENKALVYREENQTKTDALLLDQSTRKRMSGYWRMLHDAKLIGDKKFKNLMRDHIDNKMMKGFVARQLVETSQMVKLVQQLLKVRYPDTNVVPIKASVSHDLRDAAGFIKCRGANDYHHAHDAFLACRLGMFIQMRFPYVYENPIGLSHVVKDYVRNVSDEYRRRHQLPGGSGFIVNSFLQSGFDKETGEVFKDTWDAEAELAGMRRTLNYRDCFISRMPEEDAGAFWNATIYSPRDSKMGKKLSLPLKKGLDPQRYGGFSSEQFAYFFVYEAKDFKKGKRVFRFAQVPVRMTAQIARKDSALEEYARGLASDEGFQFIRIERSRILKKQLVEIAGNRLVIRGTEETRNARELAFTQDEFHAFQLLEEGASNHFLSNCGDEARLLLGKILRQGASIGHRLWNLLKLEARKEQIDALPTEEAAALVFGLCAIVNGVSGAVDLSHVGGSKNSGQMKWNFNKLLNDPNIPFYIIDQSVTGMFERRTRIGL